MKSIQRFSAKIVVLPVENVDTDQIIPARYLKTTNKAGLGDSLFADWRYNTDGQPKEDFVLNRPDVQDVEVLVAGNNFGCGSSREHAPWALLGYGFRAVISTYFADIFQNNSLKNGLLPITVDADVYTELANRFAESPEVQVTVDLESQTLTLPGDRQVTFPVDPFAKHCLLNGIDQMGFLLAEDEAIASYEAAHPARVRTVVT